MYRPIFKEDMPDYFSNNGNDVLIAGPNRTQPYALPPSIGYGVGNGGEGCVGCSGKSSNGIFSQFNNNSMIYPSSYDPTGVQSWYDYPVQEPIDPRMIIANVKLGVAGAFVRSANFIGGATWITSPFSLSGTVTCTSLHTDNALAVAEAEQWTFLHQGGNFAATNPPPLRKKLFLRGGKQFKMLFTLNLGGATYSDLQLSYRDNAATPGNFATGGTGTIPAFVFSSALTGAQTFEVTLNPLYGTFIMAISARDGSSNWSMFEMEWVVVP